MVTSGETITGIRLVDKTAGARNMQGVRVEVWFDIDQGTEAGKKTIAALKASIEENMAQRLDGNKTPQVPPCQVKSHSGFHK